MGNPINTKAEIQSNSTDPATGLMRILYQDYFFSGMDILYVDRTGTQTMNKLSVAKLLAAKSFTD